MAKRVHHSNRAVRAQILKYISGLLVPSRYWTVSAEAEHDIPATSHNRYDGQLEPTGWVNIHISVGPKGSSLIDPVRRRKPKPSAQLKRSTGR